MQKAIIAGELDADTAFLSTVPWRNGANGEPARTRVASEACRRALGPSNVTKPAGENVHTNSPTPDPAIDSARMGERLYSMEVTADVGLDFQGSAVKKASPRSIILHMAIYIKVVSIIVVPHAQSLDATTNGAVFSRKVIELYKPFILMYFKVLMVAMLLYLIYILFKRLGECCFGTWEWKGYLSKHIYNQIWQ